MNFLSGCQQQSNRITHAGILTLLRGIIWWSLSPVIKNVANNVEGKTQEEIMRAPRGQPHQTHIVSLYEEHVLQETVKRFTWSETSPAW